MDIVSRTDAYINDPTINQNGETDYGSTDLANPISRAVFGMYLSNLVDGDYTLRIEHSDDDGVLDAWTPVPLSNVIGSGYLDPESQSTLSNPIALFGVFGTKRFVRPVIVAANIVETESVSVASITHVGTTASATLSAPYALDEGDTVTISGANEPEYNGTFVISNVGVDSFDYTMASDPGANATGTILAEVPNENPHGTNAFIIRLISEGPDEDFESLVYAKLLGYASFGSDDELTIGTIDLVSDNAEGVALYLALGGYTDGDYRFVLYHSDDDGVLDPFVEIPEGSYIGTGETSEESILVPNVTGKAGFFATKRFVKVNVLGSNITSGVYLAAVFLAAASNLQPTTDPV